MKGGGAVHHPTSVKWKFQSVKLIENIHSINILQKGSVQFECWFKFVRQSKICRIPWVCSKCLEIHKFWTKGEYAIYQLITKLPLGEDRDIQSGLNCPIPQVDGLEATEKVMFTFKSEYGEEDIEYSLSKILPEKAVPILVSRVRTSPRSADHLCMLELKEVDGQNFVWPCMNCINQKS